MYAASTPQTAPHRWPCQDTPNVPGSTNFLLTAGASLGNVKEEAIALFSEDGTLIEGTVLPGLQLAVRDLFAELDRQG